MTSQLRPGVIPLANQRMHTLWVGVLLATAYLLLSLGVSGAGAARASDESTSTVAFPGGEAKKASAKPLVSPPSIVMITIDTLSRDHMSLYGYGRPTSPSFDRLQSELVIFDHAIATSPWTKPSTASLLTGLHPSEHGAYADYKVRDDVPLLAEVLAAAGYRTAAFSGNPNMSDRFGLERGFQHFDFMGGSKVIYYPDIREILNHAKLWLDTNSDGPFFLYLHLMNVHGPYRAPSQYKERFVDGPIESFPFRGPLWLDVAKRGRIDRLAEITERHLRDITAAYDGAIAYTDSVLGEFVEDLRRRELLDRSVLIVTSDHGEEFLEHGSLGHRLSLHAELLDVPLLIRSPGGKKGGLRVDEPVSLIDVPPTLLDLAGLLEDQPQGRFGSGKSLVALLAARPPTGPARAMFAELHQVRAAGTMLQLWPHRLIQMQDDSPPRLYRIDLDAAEQTNLAPKKAEVVDRLSKVEVAIRAAMDARAGAEASNPEEDELRQQLEALGYVDDVK